jgi:tetratricopeptide (TPR) repeat protein
MSLTVLATGAVRTLRAPPDLRAGLAAATAGCTAFVAAAAVDWLWELGAIPLVFFALAAIACAGGVEARRAGESTGYDHFWPRNRGRIALVALSLVGIGVLVQPLWGGIELERSYDAEADGRSADALSDARDALSIQPYSASAHLQEAVLLEDRGQLDQATDAAKEATDEEPTNWLPWYVLARIEARAGDQGRADAHWRMSRSLNPRSGVFSTGPPGHGKTSG